MAVTCHAADTAVVSSVVCSVWMRGVQQRADEVAVVSSVDVVCAACG
jgi:hypothetical protein